MKSIATLVVAVTTLMVFATNAAAQQPVEYNVTVKAEVVKGSPADHYLTFNVPVSIPDAMLPAGTYIFTKKGSSVVQVTSADGSQQLAQFFTIPIARAATNDSYVVTLAPSDGQAARRITAWYLPNQAVGLQFLYAGAESAGER